MWMARHCFFVFIVGDSSTGIDMRLPDGGVTVRGPRFPRNYMEQVEILAKAYRLAEDRYPVRQGEYLAVIDVHESSQRRHAKLMEADKGRKDSRFEEFMTV